MHPGRILEDPDHFSFGIECLYDSVSFVSLKDLVGNARAVDRMVPVVKEVGVEDAKLFQVLGLLDEWQEFFSKRLNIPLNITHIHILQCVERGTFPQLLE